MGKFSGILESIRQFVWGEELKSLPIHQRSFIFTLRIFHTIALDIAKGQLSLRAMSLVYTTVISIVPLLAISFSVLKGLGKHKEIEPALLSALEPLGEKRHEIVTRIVEFVDNIQIGVLGAMGIALLIYSVISMMQKIERSFNFAWHIDKERSFSERFSDYLSVLMLGPLFISLSVGITTSFHTNTVNGYLNSIPFMGEVIGFLGFFIPYLIMACAFGFVYFYMPNTQVNPKSAFVGGFFTAVIWKTMGIIFSTFIASSSQQTAIYSAFASIIILMTWLYVGWLVLLIGASIACYHQHPKRMLSKNNQLAMSFSHKRKFALLLMVTIAKNFEQKDTLENEASALAEQFNVSTEFLQEIAIILINQGMLVTSEDEGSLRYYPAKPLEEIKLYDITSIVEHSGMEDENLFEKLACTPKVSAYIDQTIASQQSAKNNCSLKEFINR